MLHFDDDTDPQYEAARDLACAVQDLLADELKLTAQLADRCRSELEENPADELRSRLERDAAQFELYGIPFLRDPDEALQAARAKRLALAEQAAGEFASGALPRARALQEQATEARRIVQVYEDIAQFDPQALSHAQTQLRQVRSSVASVAEDRQQLEAQLTAALEV